MNTICIFTPVALQDRSRSPKKELKTDPSKLTEEDLQADEPLNICRLIGYWFPSEVRNYLGYWEIGSIAIFDGTLGSII